MQDEINELILTHQKLVYKQLHRFNLVNDPEAESKAFWALYKAIESHKVDGKASLSTYATVCIYNALGSHVRSLNKVRQLDELSYDKVAYTSDSVQYTHLSFMASDETADGDLLKDDRDKEIHRALNEVLASFTNEKHIAVVVTWIDSEYDATTQDIAKKVGVSQPYASHVLSMFKNKMKLKLEAYINE